MQKTSYTHLSNTEEGESQDFDDYPEISPNDQARISIRHAVIYLLLGLSDILFFSLWLISIRKTNQAAASCARPQLIYSPATEALRYEKKRLWRDIDGPNPFSGSPRPELDKAWHDILDPITIKVTADELFQFAEGDSSIALKDGSGYIAEMGVYHELHCVKRIRRYIHLEHYYPNMTAEDRIVEDKHIDHCLEYWREAAMCRGDVTLGTYFWREDGFPTSQVYTDNECIDWRALDTWARKRMVDMTDYSILEG
ncbi:hypothetical protein CC78DRAFT_501936 [Lojkania enalia]|uniref:Tat pathway signal sequence protein n=1 Tax=Lojkania enalia TaxID=147567 RepID=A0A9P4JZU4_9PLEO|nr:hypothetical protein CC78DRAFT_501936 [Didymosphaeria enalia]